MPPLPNSGNSAYPPAQPQHFGGGYPPFPQSQPPQHNSGYPQQPQFPSQSQYAPPNAGFGSHMPFPSQQTSYPSMPSMPSMPPMPSSTGYPTHSYNPYPTSQSQGYGHAGFQQPPSNPSSGYQGMVNVFSEMQGHIKDTRKSKVSSGHSRSRCVSIFSIAIMCLGLGKKEC